MLETPSSPQEFHSLADIDGESIVSVLSQKTTFSKQKIKDCMRKGAVWLGRGKHTRRIRRLNSTLKKGDELHFYYNESVLNQACPPAKLIEDNKEYSIWYKPYGMLSQGSKWSDHCTITRWAERHLVPERPAFIVHRLDKATTGLIIVAHTKKAARLLTNQFEQRQIEKKYQAIVHGDHRSRLQPDTVRETIDGKHACSHFNCLQYDQQKNVSLVDVAIETGRKHQIRRHLADIGFPIVGDRLYGCDSDGVDLQLCAYSLQINCPVTLEVKRFVLEKNNCLSLDVVKP